jgi:FlaG/FlaF family flagellin (archaellin)
MLTSKKAVSPLIATVLLIVVVVGIGAVVTGIVRDYVSESKRSVDSKNDAMSCSRDVVVDVVDIGGVQQVCKGTNYVDIVVENVGTKKVDDFQLIIYATTGIYRNDSIAGGTATTPGQAREFNVTFSGITAGSIEQVKLVPKLKKSGSASYSFCSDVALKFEGVATC